MERITRDQMLMAMAHVASLRGTCNRLSVGAVLAFQNRPVSLGYNGAPPGKPHCNSECNLENPCTNTDHAEANAIEWARTFGIDPMGSTIYITDSPCPNCASKIVEAGVVRVVYDREYRDLKALGILTKHGVEISQCSIKNVIGVSFPVFPTTRAYRG